MNRTGRHSGNGMMVLRTQGKGSKGDNYKLELVVEKSQV